MAKKNKDTKPKKEKVSTGGRPRYEVDVYVLEELAEIHCTYEEMSRILQVSVDTLQRHFADIIERARSRNRACLRRQLWSTALKKDHLGAMIWLSKQTKNQGGLEFTEKIESKTEVVESREFKIGWADDDESPEANTTTQDASTKGDSESQE